MTSLIDHFLPDDPPRRDRVLALRVARALLVSFASSALDALTDSLDEGRRTFDANCGYASEAHLASIESEYDGARLAVDTLSFYGPTAQRGRVDWDRVQTDAYAADRARPHSERSVTAPL